MVIKTKYINGSLFGRFALPLKDKSSNYLSGPLFFKNTLPVLYEIAARDGVIKHLDIGCGPIGPIDFYTVAATCCKKVFIRGVDIAEEAIESAKRMYLTTEEITQGFRCLTENSEEENLNNEKALNEGLRQQYLIEPYDSLVTKYLNQFLSPPNAAKERLFKIREGDTYEISQIVNANSLLWQGQGLEATKYDVTSINHVLGKLTPAEQIEILTEACKITRYLILPPKDWLQFMGTQSNSSLTEEVIKHFSNLKPVQNDDGLILPGLLEVQSQ